MGKTYRKNDLDIHGCLGSYLKSINENKFRSFFHPTDEQLLAYHEWDIESWNSKNRDGKTGLSQGNDTTNKRFKHRCKRNHRAQTKFALQKGQKRMDWDDINFPCKKNGKVFIWDFW
jgi:hypothetical protein